LNIPFIDLLERVGPRSFAAALQGVGMKLAIPGGEPNLAIILGGAGTSLEQLVTSYGALARGGKVIPLKYLKKELSAPVSERYLLSEGAAWVTLNTLAAVTRPGSLNTLAPVQARQRLAWKTGTSFGYRDTWAIGVTKKYTIGVWIGRPDGTPLQGHSGRETAGPLLFAVADHMQLQRDKIEQPATVKQQEICWPLGVNTPNDQHCHQRHTAWVVGDNVPPTWHHADNDAWQTNPLSFWVNAASNLRVDGHCEQSTKPIKKQKKTVALWPKVLEPWLSKDLRRAHQIPAVDGGCQHQVITAASTLKITGVVQNSLYRSAGNSTVHPSVSLQAIGGSGKYHWYINGVRRYSGSSTRVIPHPLKESGDVQILVVDDNGNIDKVDIVVM
jgi:penicillin-binding protein 1C